MMKGLLQYLKVLGTFVLLATSLAIAYVFVMLPKAEPAPSIQITATPQQIAHGRYLANHVLGCLYCHSMRNSGYYASPVVAGTEGQGFVFLENAELGLLVAPNITPAGLSDWSDGEILRAITGGVNRDGRPLFPIMPYKEYSTMPREDLYSVIAYVRTLEPKNSDLPRTKLKFPLNLIVRTMPKPAAIQEEQPAPRGEYLTNIASCRSCHTPLQPNGARVPGMDFAGGRSFKQPDGTMLRSMNLTPDEETGIGSWSREQFISVFKRYETADLRQIPVEKGNTVMPWTYFAGMTPEDLGAIYDYLRTVKPVSNKIENKVQSANSHL